jgi:hypothetical protein
VQPGTPNSGATLANLTGAPAQNSVPSAMPICYALVPPTGSMTSANILDLRPRDRGKRNVGATDTVTSTTYALAGTTAPDQIKNIILPTDGLIAVAYQATWQESVADAALAAIHVGGTQVKMAATNTTVGQETDTGSSATVNKDRPLFSTSAGLMSALVESAPTYGGDSPPQLVGGLFITQGMTGEAGSNWGVYGGGEIIGALGGPCYIFANAGTYDVDVRFKASSGNVVVKNRRLWVWSMAF